MPIGRVMTGALATLALWLSVSAAAPLAAAAGTPGGPAAVAAARSSVPQAPAELRAVLLGLEDRYVSLLVRPDAGCSAAERARARLEPLRRAAVGVGQRAGVRRLVRAIGAMSVALGRLAGAVEACAARDRASAPAVIGASFPGPVPPPDRQPAALPITLADVVAGAPLDASGVLGPLTLSERVATVALADLAGGYCARAGAVCVGLDRALLDGSLRALLRRDVLQVLLGDVAALDLEALLAHLQAVSGRGDLGGLVAVERAGERVLRLRLTGPLAALGGAAGVEAVVIGRLQVVPEPPAPSLPPPPVAGVAIRPVDQPLLGRRLIVAMNRARAARRLPALRHSARLARPAQGHSRLLTARRSLDHDGPPGAPFYTRLVRAGFPVTVAMGENLAVVAGCDPVSVGEVVGLWLSSPRHRANLLSRTFALTGIGVASTPGCGLTFYTADFVGRGRPRR
jgi:uncharacterized protein YkwD